MAGFPLIVVGTYEEFVLGYHPQFENEKNIRCKLHQSFATHSHQASVRCVAAHGKIMASSGADEYINIYDMTAMEVSTVINYHNATVTCLEFTPDGSHLVTANQNGDIAIFRCCDWTLVKLWKEAHKHANGVLSMSVHPSGSLLLTTGADNIVRFWNLVKGRLAYAKNFSKSCSVGNSLNFGTWSENGKYYSVCVGNVLEIYKTATAALVYKVETTSRITCSSFFKKSFIYLAMEDGTLEIHSVNKKLVVMKNQIHKNRVKNAGIFSSTIFKNEKEITRNYLISVDSKGSIKLWHLKKKGLQCSLLPRGEVDCDCRITCLTVVNLKNIKKEQNGFHEKNIIGNSEELPTVNKIATISEKSNASSKKKLKRNINENENLSTKAVGITLESNDLKEKKGKFSRDFSSSKNRDRKDYSSLNLLKNKKKNKKRL